MQFARLLGDDCLVVSWSGEGGFGALAGCSVVGGGSGRGLNHSNHVQHRLQDGRAPHRSDDDGDGDDGRLRG